jgi:hypothetical protein
MMHTSRFLTALAIASTASSAALAQTASLLDRSGLAEELKIDAATGELLAVPDAYARIRGISDRSALAGQINVDPATGQFSKVPESYPSPGALDRSHLAQELAVDAQGRLTDVPKTYADVRGLDRAALAQQIAVDLDTGRFEKVPESYPDVHAANRIAQAPQVDFATGEIRDVPHAFPSDFDADTLFDPSDNCPFFANPDQADTDLNRRGDACECSDQSLNGTVNVLDIPAINRAIFDPSLVTPLCDGNDDGLCNVSDMVAANVTIFVPKNSICERQPVPGP